MKRSVRGGETQQRVVIPAEAGSSPTYMEWSPACRPSLACSAPKPLVRAFPPSNQCAGCESGHDQPD